ncbi:MAG: hypothetical protein KL787_00655 [Taibaiella sp.]|nr:hypothetical protein [Taibaiella sp.]MBX9448301.1 hypothetical protein [Taibaiella sp.]
MPATPALLNGLQKSSRDCTESRIHILSQFILNRSSVSNALFSYKIAGLYPGITGIP